ncbi:hypothetical protein KAU33_06995 [Candidatus Dependentiae bacterium]|nr:hypothetical protein [Candidatus Dependentiae bacterium]
MRRKRSKSSKKPDVKKVKARAPLNTLLVKIIIGIILVFIGFYLVFSSAKYILPIFIIVAGYAIIAFALPISDKVKSKENSNERKE